MSLPSNNSKYTLKKISLRQKQRCFRVAILGQNGVGKSALTVRFLTRRFIGEYDPTLEQVYRCHKSVHGSNVDFEILDTAVQYENNCMEENIRWADAFILMYSVTDTCSFNECCRLKFLINSYCKKRRPLRMTSDPSSKVTIATAPVILVGNQIDKTRDRMVTFDEGRRRACEMGCVGFYEVSVSEMTERITEIFDDLYITLMQT
ncbi:ras-related and estrogen-regulated growth inhibitor-like [Patella vulgata]|uniref:ras-related and estrogen-regulated growth inhibitor-like n=1 Tax=Patella vulgata TaxID=6465 RepID=UPI0021802BD2|nr:ras-related and estrogen-regulated growth inhibitor-like [Patella vulgata]